jgi:alpha-ketoglutarate-dependent taurine dioxygenase
MTTDTLISTALTNGFVTFSFDDFDGARLKRALNRIGMVTETSLSVKERVDSRPRTYSAAFGTGFFPFHTDFAFRAKPPRLILLSNQTDATYHRATLVSDTASLSAQARTCLKRSAWKLGANGRTFIVSGCGFMDSEQFVRWDPQVLQPANCDAMRCLASIPDQLVQSQHSFTWKPRTGLLMNNWRVAHARAAVSFPESESRHLLRYEVW